MTTAADIGWGRYKGYRGPFFRGSQWLKLHANPSPDFKRVYISSSSEGGYDSINMYDKCTVSIGMNQACETPWFLTTKLIAAIAEAQPALLDPLKPALDASNAVFKRTSRGRWRFHFLDHRGEVDAGAEQKGLFLLNSDGTKGSWDDESKAHGKLWAACLANMLVQPLAKEVQVAWSAKRIAQYAMPKAKKVLFDGSADEGWVGAMRAGYLSYALNIPTKADKMLQLALTDAPGAKWSPEWCTHIFRVMTFKSGVGIWPHRYNAIRKHLAQLYGIDLPDGSKELDAWKADMGLEPKTSWERIIDEDLYEADGEEPPFTTTKEIQQFLIDQGYDLGPWGADGRSGAKTEDAVMTFQSTHQLGADGIVGPQPRQAMLDVYRAKVCA